LAGGKYRRSCCSRGCGERAVDGAHRAAPKHELGQRPPAEIAKARIRLVIESVFSTLKQQMRMEDHLAKTLLGLAQRIGQRLLALTLAMLINALLAAHPEHSLPTTADEPTSSL
jgi:hypothetical protein